MPGELIRLAGPGGGGKSQVARQMLESGEADLVADTTALFVALSGQERDAEGKYPVRADDALLLPLALYVRRTVVREALRRELRVIKTSSTPTDLDADRALTRELGASFRERVIDPGEAVIRSRLADPATGAVSPECQNAIGRWYAPGGVTVRVTGVPPPLPSRPRPRRGRRR